MQGLSGPGSHISPVTISPSPQMGEQENPSSSHLNPSSLMQLSEQPSDPTVFESSHSSSNSRTPFPHPTYQICKQSETGLEPSHIQFVSIMQVLEHPSPFSISLSSHSSAETKIPSPQVGEQIEGDPAQVYPVSF